MHSDGAIKMTNITKVEFKTGELHIEPDTVLEKAKGVYTSVLIIGWDMDGNLDVRSTTNLNAPDLLFLSSAFSHNLLSGDYRER